MPNIWSRINTLLLIIVLVAITAMMAMRASGGPLDPPGPPASTDAVRQPGTPISSAPFTITSPGHYYVTRNLTHNAASPAITIAASNVTLDLGGFLLLGADTPGSSGVFVSGFHFPITIENGIVRDFAIGVDGVNGSMVKIRNVTAYSNGVGVLVGNVTEISDCTVGVSALQGIRVVGSLGRIQNCLIFDSWLAGVEIEGSKNVVESNRLVRNAQTSDFGIEDVTVLDIGSSANVIRGNTVGGGLYSAASDTAAVGNVWCGSVGSPPLPDIDNVTVC